jgi:16S rRNA (guanine966-N2)-methyltransferase
MIRNQVRIIGGKHRGRKVSFPPIADLRPTPDRVRETLFNWLNPGLPQSRCLDLFAGSGVLGLEALSRGAEFVVFVEKNPTAADSIQTNADTFHETAFQIIHGNVLSWLEAQTQVLKTKENTFDVVFLDPPYQSNLLSPCFMLLEKSDLLNPQAKIYFESHDLIQTEQLPVTWRLLHEKKAGHVYYYLAEQLEK